MLTQMPSGQAHLEAADGASRTVEWTTAIRASRRGSALRTATVCALAIGGAALAIGVQRWFLPEPMALPVLLGAGLLIPLERLRPRRAARVLRPGWTADVAHSLTIGVTSRVLAFPALVLAALVARSLVPPALHHAVAGQAGWLQAIEVLVIMMVGGYWSHRLAHEIPWLWQFHKVHHAVAELDWLAGRRNHPVAGAVTNLLQTVPVILLGYDVRLVLALNVLLGVHTLLVHANVGLHCHWLGRIVVTPDYHHWHHSTDPAHHDTNYASELPVLDMIFGTYNFPRDEYAEEVGLDEDAPTTFLGQLLWPLRRPSNADDRAA